MLTFTRHQRCLPFTLALSNLQLTGGYHRRLTSYGIRYQQYNSSSTAAIYTVSTWAVPYFQVFTQPSAAVIRKCCHTHYQTCLSIPTFFDEAYQCLPQMNTFNNCTHSQTCLSMLTSIDKAYQCLPPLSIINGRRLPRNSSNSKYRNRHDPLTS